MRIVAKLSPMIFEVGIEAKPGDTIGVVTGFVESVSYRTSYGGFEYKSPYTTEPSTSRVLVMPEQYDDLFDASKSKPIAVGFIIRLGYNNRPFMVRFDYEPEN